MSRAAGYFTDMIAAVHVCHNRGLVHGDICVCWHSLRALCPASPRQLRNFLVSKSGHVFLGDFDQAKLVSARLVLLGHCQLSGNTSSHHHRSTAFPAASAATRAHLEVIIDLDADYS